MGTRGTEKILNPHRKTVEAIVARDPEAAEFAGREDAQSFIDEFMDSLAKPPTAFFDVAPVLPNPELRPSRFLAHWTYIIDEPKAAVST
jgi:hypothetical protein